MSHDLDGRIRLDDRAKIHNLTGFGSETNKSNEFCRGCYSSGRGRLIPHPTEKGKLFCRNCGSTFDIEETPKEQSEKKYATKYPAVYNTLIVTKKDKKKTPAGLSDEDKQDIANFFGTSEGAKLVDESTTYTDEGGRY